MPLPLHQQGPFFAEMDIAGHIRWVVFHVEQASGHLHAIEYFSRNDGDESAPWQSEGLQYPDSLNIFAYQPHAATPHYFFVKSSENKKLMLFGENQTGYTYRANGTVAPVIQTGSGLLKAKNIGLLLDFAPISREIELLKEYINNQHVVWLQHETKEAAILTESPSREEKPVDNTADSHDPISWEMEREKLWVDIFDQRYPKPNNIDNETDEESAYEMTADERERLMLELFGSPTDTTDTSESFSEGVSDDDDYGNLLPKWEILETSEESLESPIFHFKLRFPCVLNYTQKILVRDILNEPWTSLRSQTPSAKEYLKALIGIFEDSKKNANELSSETQEYADALKRCFLIESIDNFGKRFYDVADTEDSENIRIADVFYYMQQLLIDEIYDINERYHIGIDDRQLRPAEAVNAANRYKIGHFCPAQMEPHQDNLYRAIAAFIPIDDNDDDANTDQVARIEAYQTMLQTLSLSVLDYLNCLARNIYDNCTDGIAGSDRVADNMRAIFEQGNPPLWADWLTALPSITQAIDKKIKEKLCTFDIKAFREWRLLMASVLKTPPQWEALMPLIGGRDKHFLDHVLKQLGFTAEETKDTSYTAMILSVLSHDNNTITTWLKGGLLVTPGEKALFHIVLSRLNNITELKQLRLFLNTKTDAGVQALIQQIDEKRTAILSQNIQELSKPDAIACRQTELPAFFDMLLNNQDILNRFDGATMGSLVFLIAFAFDQTPSLVKLNKRNELFKLLANAKNLDEAYTQRPENPPPTPNSIATFFYQQLENIKRLNSVLNSIVRALKKEINQFQEDCKAGNIHHDQWDNRLQAILSQVANWHAFQDYLQHLEKYTKKPLSLPETICHDFKKLASTAITALIDTAPQWMPHSQLSVKVFTSFFDIIDPQEKVNNATYYIDMFVKNPTLLAVFNKQQCDIYPQIITMLMQTVGDLKHTLQLQEVITNKPHDLKALIHAAFDRYANISSMAKLNSSIFSIPYQKTINQLLFWANNEGPFDILTLNNLETEITSALLKMPYQEQATDSNTSAHKKTQEILYHRLLYILNRIDYCRQNYTPSVEKMVEEQSAARVACMA